MLRLTGTTRIRLVVATDQITERRSVIIFVDLSANRTELVLRRKIHQCLTEAEGGQHNVEHPLETLDNVFVNFLHPHKHNSQDGRDTCRYRCIPCQC